MKKNLFLALIITACYSCSNSGEGLLTHTYWEVEKIVYLKTGLVKITEPSEEKIWNFEPNNTYQYNIQEELNVQNFYGNWNLKDDNLLIFNDSDTTRLLIEKLTDNEMIWITKGNDSIRFYLNPKAKKYPVPDFSNLPQANSKSVNSERLVYLTSTLHEFL